VPEVPLVGGSGALSRADDVPRGELRGVEPLTSCMPCSFGPRGSLRSGAPVQPNDPVRVTTTVRWLPSLPASCGMRGGTVGEDEATSNVARWLELSCWARPVLGDYLPRGQEPEGLAADRAPALNLQTLNLQTLLVVSSEVQ
jgi:hypothetical protein